MMTLKADTLNVLEDGIEIGRIHFIPETGLWVFYAYSGNTPLTKDVLEEIAGFMP